MHALLKSSLLGLPFLGLVKGAAVPLTLFDLNEYPNARCLDGTPAGFYVQPASNSEQSNKWVIYLEGGGECDKEDACKAQTSSNLGSSNYFSNTSDSSGWFIASDYCPYNPDFCEWNHVRDPYCTQDLHSGQVTEATDDTWGLYFAGHHVLAATLDALDKHYDMQSATEIILSGASAGGIGVWMNVDYIADRYPNARVTAFTVAGHYFFATFYDGVNHTYPGTMGDFRESALPVTFDLYDAFVDKGCQSDYESRNESPGACLLSNNSYPFIESSSFVVQAQTDSVVLTGHDCYPDTYMTEEPEVEFMTEWSDNMTVALGPLMAPENKNSGVFAAACYSHTGFNHAAPILDGMNFYQAFSNFYFQKTGPEEYKLSDTCGILCNPTCTSQPTVAPTSMLR